VRLQNYKSMPHVFQIFQKHPSTETCFREYARFIKDVTDTGGNGIETELRYVNGKGQVEETALDLEKYNVGFTKEEVCSLGMVWWWLTCVSWLRGWSRK
jgi:hypothetical protein